MDHAATLDLETDMSDIPQARAILTDVLRMQMPNQVRARITMALSLMKRQRPDRIVRDGKSKVLGPREGKRAVALRKRGKSKAAIALKLKTQIGRVTQAIRKYGP
jgi:hypothetical protein